MMADNVRIDFLLCPECSGHKFRTEVRVALDKRLKPREQKHWEIPPSAMIQREILYICTKCGHELEL